MLKTVLHHQPHALAGPDFFPHTLVDDHVRVDRHSKGENNTGDTGECEDCSNGCENTKEEEYIGEQCNIGNMACAIIIQRHVKENTYESNDEGDQTAIDRFFTK